MDDIIECIKYLWPLALVAIMFFTVFLCDVKQHLDRKEFINKYGQPLKHFSCQKAYNGSCINMDFYGNSLIITDTDDNSGMILKKDFKNYMIYGSFLIRIFEVNGLKIVISNKEKKYIEDFFEE